MATVCYINVYNSHVDRGATVSRVPLEHYEVDEEEIKVGNPLPKWPIDGGSPIVKAYDGKHLTLERHGKIFTFNVGDEEELDYGEHNVGMGVISRTYYYVKLISTELIYKGGWQQGSIITQKLNGPIGNGEVHYPNGDHFKGTFHLSYASINGPAYAAEGRYTFADGSYIERAWINTSKDRKPEFWGLRGVFRVHHPDGLDSIAMFVRGKRYGFELFLAEKPYQSKVTEWYANEEVIRWKSDEPEKIKIGVVDYEIDENSRVDCLTMKLTINDRGQEYRIIQEGGKYTENQYGSYVYEPSTRVTAYLPGGDSIDHDGTSLRNFMPYDGYLTMHDAKTGMCRSERWENGEQKEAKEWKRDDRAAKSVELPDPFGQGKSQAKVWRDGYIDYSHGEWTYEGEMAYDRPQGKGVLTGGIYRHEGERYEGEFHAGRCHGQGVYVNEQAGIRQDGEWRNGVFQEPHAATVPIMLHARHGHKSWSISGSSDWKWEESDFEAALGTLNFTGFRSVKIVRIEKNCITLTSYDRTELLTPGETVSFYAEIEGREWSDGCVYDGDDYSLELTWVTSN